MSGKKSELDGVIASELELLGRKRKLFAEWAVLWSRHRGVLVVPKDNLDYVRIQEISKELESIADREMELLEQVRGIIEQHVMN